MLVLCFVLAEAVASSPSELTSGLGEQHYTTKTRGERVQPGARAVGEGPYVLAKGGKSGGVHWGYKLEVPHEPGQAQKVLGIRLEGSYVISAKVRGDTRPDEGWAVVRQEQ